MNNAQENDLPLRKRQAKSTRSRIYNTAFELITRHGFDNVTVDEICRQSGVRKGAFYHHFKSKDDIIIEAYKRIDGDLLHEIATWPAGMGNEEKILFIVLFQARKAYIEGVVAVRPIYKSQIDKGTSFFISPDRPFYRNIRDAVAAGQTAGEFSADMSPEELTRLVLSISRGIIYDWCMDDGRYDIVRVMESSFQMILSGLRRR